MARPRTGSVEPFRRADGALYYKARIRLADNTRTRVDIPEEFCHPAGGKSGQERREMYALAGQEHEDETGELLKAKQQKQEGGAAGEEDCTAYFYRLKAHRAELGRRGGRDDESTWNAWLRNRIGHLAIRKVGRDEIEGVRDVLDEAIALHKRTERKEGISAKRALNVWCVVTTMFKAACACKRRDLRVRGDNPCIGVLPPERGRSRGRPFVYPVEAMQVLSYAEVPLPWRELYAVSCYLYLRPGETKALLVSDVNLTALVVHITKAFDERTGKLGPPKTANGVRDVPIPLTLVPLLERLVEGRSPTEVLLPIMSEWSEDQRALKTRQHLRLAGVTRPRLFEDTVTTMHVGFRSWRDTGITWLALATVDAVKIQRRAGHDDIKTTLGYVKQAEDISGTIGAPFPPLPPCLVHPSEAERAKVWAKPRGGPPRRAESLTKAVRRAGLESVQVPEVIDVSDGPRTVCPPPVDVSARTVVPSGPSEVQSTTAPRSVEDALAEAVAEASRAGRWDIVAQLARELEARRLASAGIPSISGGPRR